MKIASLIAASLAAALGTATAPAHAAYPDKPVTIIVPFAPGGGSDNIARYVASRLSERTGSTFVIENKPGAGTNIGNQLAARAPADGYTLLFGQVTLSINPYLYKDLGYDVKKNFVPVGMIATSPTVLIVADQFPARTLREAIDLIRGKPGTVNFGSGGAGTSVHLSGELFKSLIQGDMQHVPYKGSSPAMTDLIGGRLQMMFDTAPSALPQIKGRKVRALAVTGKSRLADLPDVPTFAEAGLPAFDAPAWYGMLAPAGTPAGVVATLNEQINAVLGEAATRRRMQELGVAPSPGTPEDMAAFMDTEGRRWQATVRSANVSLE
ncbi:Bug family tripartite tricarboxylate transporter substrate binding protein [Pigmentiphaga kullae]|uniref:Tripartite-type tricarboxylate transporter receptor subunit TctC n=1 Tax=Pigmentiphaga kullae TaxID=151784 RepID=A0A4Q7NIQ2_9BURK|nr:tripartite tricarboxylate transporter substrate binding protein [Pigmentiphaga kullae]RZS84692.1 tripartite-type tricarboxylate transporter receptor subunit TctC [Pigmentiphaga kullae]